MGVLGLLPSSWQNIQESLPVFLEVGGSVVEHCCAHVTFMEVCGSENGVEENIYI